MSLARPPHDAILLDQPRRLFDRGFDRPVDLHRVHPALELLQFADVKFKVVFPAEIVPVNAPNDRVVSGKTVTFPAFPRRVPQRAFEYMVAVRGCTTAAHG